MLLLGRKYLCERWDTVNELRVFSRVSAGEGTGQGREGARSLPIVLVHGLGVSSRYMTPLASEFAKRGYRVMAPDLPGYGRSEKPRQALPVMDLAESLRDWLRVVRIGPALFVGNSMGCQILTELAHVDPSAILGLAFLGPTMDQFAPSHFSHVGRLLKDQLYEPLSLLPIQAFDYLGNGPLRTVETFLHAVKHDMLGRVRDLAVPCLFLRGERDPIAPEQWVQALNYAVPGAADLGVVPRAGHALNYNSAPVILPEILRFWREHGIAV